MVELISAVIFVGSVAGVGTLIARKMPQAMHAVEIRQDLKLAGFVQGLKKWLEAKIKQYPRFKDFSWIDFAQKQLLKSRVLVMKAENKINEYMLKLRSHAEEQKKTKDAQSDNYWHDLRTIVKTKKPFTAQKTAKPSEIEPEPLSGEEADPAGGTVYRAEEAAAEIEMFAKRVDEPLNVRVVMPEQVSSEIQNLRSKKKHNSKKKRYKDPFRW
jgi:hypothetical protein